mgnify:CR=1 FL=1
MSGDEGVAHFTGFSGSRVVNDTVFEVFLKGVLDGFPVRANEFLRIALDDGDVFVDFGDDEPVVRRGHG